MRIELQSSPEVRAVIRAAFPDYRKKTAFVEPFGERGKGINSYWDGGSKTVYVVVHLATLQPRALPTSTHPYFDVARKGAAGQENQDLIVDERGNVTLKRLPEEFALVSAGWFSGKPSTASVYVNPAHLAKLLPAGVSNGL